MEDEDNELLPKPNAQNIARRLLSEIILMQLDSVDVLIREQCVPVSVKQEYDELITRLSTKK